MSEICVADTFVANYSARAGLHFYLKEGSPSWLCMGLLGALVLQDPQEMAWIEGQASIFVCITLLLLALCVVKGLLGVRARRAEEEHVREGMGWLFSVVEGAPGYPVPRNPERASSSYP